jgi:hypothetical protein
VGDKQRAAMILAGRLALDNHCPVDMKTIDAKLATKPVLSATDAANVAQLRAAGEELRTAGRHEQSMGR